MAFPMVFPISKAVRRDASTQPAAPGGLPEGQGLWSQRGASSLRLLGHNRAQAGDPMADPWEKHRKTIGKYGKTMGIPEENGGLMGF